VIFLRGTNKKNVSKPPVIDYLVFGLLDF